MKESLRRTALLIGKDNVEKLNKYHVLVFGVGGVGGYLVEALARSGINNFTLVDNDKVNESNINRQIIATYDSIGRYKVDVMKERILSINKDANVEVRKCFYLPENKDEFDFTKYDYVADCVDTISAKLSIIEEAKKNNVPIISAMGAGNKIHPELFEVSDISKTEMDPLSKVIRLELRKRGINHLKVIYSKEKPLQNNIDESLVEYKEKSNRPVVGSIAFVPSVMGLLMGKEIILDLINK